MTTVVPRVSVGPVLDSLWAVWKLILFVFHLQVRLIPIQLQKLFARLLLLNQQSAAVDALTTSFGWRNNEVCITWSSTVFF